MVDLLLPALPDQLEDIADILFPDGLPPGGQGHQIFNDPRGIHHLLRVLPGNFQLRVPVHHRDPQLRFDQSDIFVKGAKDTDRVLQTLQALSLIHIYQSL